MGSSRERNAPPLVELSHVPDVFVSGIGRIDKLGGGMVRVVFYAEERASDGSVERVVVAKIVRPLATWHEALKMIAQHMDSPLLTGDGEGRELDS